MHNTDEPKEHRRKSFHLSRNSGEIFEHIFSLSPSHCSTWPFINPCALIKQSLAKTNICTMFASFTILQDYFPCSMSNSKKGVYFYGRVGKERALPWSCRPQLTVIFHCFVCWWGNVQCSHTIFYMREKKYVRKKAALTFFLRRERFCHLQNNSAEPDYHFWENWTILTAFTLFFFKR